MNVTGTLQKELIGRESELAVVHEFLAPGPLPRALVVTGEPGIGKTTLWEAAIDAAVERRIRVLSTRANGAEARLSFAGLSDVLDGIDIAALEALPAPQLHALEVALLRVEAAHGPPDSRAIALGLLNAVRALAAREPVLIALDDIQWLDPASASAIAFAARRLAREPILFVVTRRPGAASDIERAFERGDLQRLDLGPLSLGAVRRLLSARLELSVPRHLLRRIVASTLGNPLFALELGRVVVERGMPAPGQQLAVPDTVEALLGTRAERLPAPVRRLLLAVALSADLSTAQLATLADAAAVDDALDAGVLVLEGDRVRAAHPLLAAVEQKRSGIRERRALHLELSRLASDEALRARHRALAAEGPDEELAAAVAGAAARASARGARQEAVELAEHALRLSPSESAVRSDRLLELAQYLDAAGQLRRVTALLGPEVDRLSPGPTRARAHLLLASDLSHVDQFERHLDQAYEESERDSMLRATVLATKAAGIVVGLVERIGAAESWAHEAVSLSRAAAGAPDPAALEALGWTRILTGRGLDDLKELFGDDLDASLELFHSLERVDGIRRAFHGEVDEAREIFTRLLELADERGEEWSFYTFRLQLCELELRAGYWEAAAQLLDEWEPSPDEGITSEPAYARCRALLAAGRGFVDEAERLSAEATIRSEAAGVRWDQLEALRARGIAALLAGEPTRAAAGLRTVWAHARREGVDDPGAFPVAPDLVEALVEVGELDEAKAAANRLRELSERQKHPWGLATARRCDALVGLAAGYDERAAGELERAAADYEALGLRFDRARSLLVLGRAQRRHRKWGAARRSLEQAIDAFEEIGSVGWAGQACSELSRVGARRPRPAGELTPSEARAAELAAEGLANKEIAQTLFVSVRTVEEHLSNVYAKLGVRSRTQLASRLKD
jgi:DNA-binding CsgD family transcriptional regulator